MLSWLKLIFGLPYSGGTGFVCGENCLSTEEKLISGRTVEHKGKLE